jgi:hypothetical protein
VPHFPVPLDAGYPRSTAVTNEHSPDILLKKDKSLARHLSRNQALHVYAETQEEQLVSTVRDMHDAFACGNEEDALKMLEAARTRPGKAKDSKLVKVLHNDRLMLCLMHDLLPMGEHFRARQEITVRWLADTAINVNMGVSNDMFA